LPGLNGFAGEFLVLLGAFQRVWAGPVSEWTPILRGATVLAVSGVVLGAWYMLWLVQRVFFGPLREPTVVDHNGHSAGEVRDMSWREVAALAPLAVFVLWIGIHPKPFLDRMEPTLNPIAARVESAWLAGQGSTAGTNRVAASGGEQDPAIDGSPATLLTSLDSGGKAETRPQGSSSKSELIRGESLRGR
jgi:formate hydrogenlyase subunit 3/multisubunit Na+/H+ antiporter MnhD subunit